MGEVGVLGWGWVGEALKKKARAEGPEERERGHVDGGLSPPSRLCHPLESNSLLRGGRRGMDGRETEGRLWEWGHYPSRGVLPHPAAPHNLANSFHSINHSSRTASQHPLLPESRAAQRGRPGGLAGKGQGLGITLS